MQDYVWQWFHEPKESKYPRMGCIGSEPIADGEVRFAVFGGLDSLNYGIVDAKTGDPYFPGPYFAGGPFADETQVESVARAIMSAWRAGRAGGLAAHAENITAPVVAGESSR